MHNYNEKISLIIRDNLKDYKGSTTVNFQMFKLVLEKAEKPKIKLPTSIGLLKKQEF